MNVKVISAYKKWSQKLVSKLLFILITGAYLLIDHDSFTIEIILTCIFISFYVYFFLKKRIFILNSFWILGNFLSWVLFYALLIYNFSGISDLDFFRPYLFNIFLIGITFANFLCCKLKLETKVITVQKSNLLLALGIITLIGYVMSGGLNSRELGSQFAKDFTSFYYIQAFLFSFYLISLTAGYYLKVNLYSLIFLAILLVNFIGGHRGEFIANGLFFIVGILLNSTHSRTIKFAMPSVLIIGICFVFLSIGNKRLNSVESSELSPLENNLQRIIEPSGQVVIDQVTKDGSQAGFENFSRILTMPIPSFLIKDKPFNDDSNEILNRDFGYTDLGDMTSIPIPFIADSYRRFGAKGVFFFSLVIGLLFNLTSFVILKSNKAWSIPLFLITILYALKLYPQSVLGTISFFLYVMVKFYLIFQIIYNNIDFKKVFIQLRNS